MNFLVEGQSVPRASALAATHYTVVSFWVCGLVWVSLLPGTIARLTILMMDSPHFPLLLPALHGLPHLLSWLDIKPQGPQMTACPAGVKGDQLPG